MIKYTCDPLRRTYYADFLGTAVIPSQLTNGVTFRISGQATGKAVTGDGGQKGVTGFGSCWPATTRSRRTSRTTRRPTFFCGLDVNNPTLKAVNQAISVNLAGTAAHLRGVQRSAAGHEDDRIDPDPQAELPDQDPAGGIQLRGELQAADVLGPVLLEHLQRRDPSSSRRPPAGRTPMACSGSTT